MGKFYNLNLRTLPGVLSVLVLFLLVLFLFAMMFFKLFSNKKVDGVPVFQKIDGQPYFAVSCSSRTKNEHENIFCFFADLR